MASKKLNEEKMVEKTETGSLGVGLDVGTMNLVSARTEGGKTIIKPIRDAFLDLELDAKRSLKLSNAEFVEIDDKLVVLGDSALQMANLFKRDARRPLSKGVISAGELDAQQILSILIEKILGKPRTEGEHCFYSVPAAPVDVPGQDIVYHTEVFRMIVEELGYTAHPTNEAMAIIFSNCAKESFSGLAVSHGAGMVNVALASKASCGLEFSVAKGGDWIDENSARAVGKTASQMCAIKEQGINLLKPEDRNQQAIAMYIRNLITSSLKAIASEFKKVANDVQLDAPIPLVISGGTTKAAGFLELYKQEFEKVRKSFPIQISEVRQATDPLSAVAEGLLVLASSEHEDA